MKVEPKRGRKQEWEQGQGGQEGGVSHAQQTPTRTSFGSNHCPFGSDLLSSGPKRETRVCYTIHNVHELETRQVFRKEGLLFFPF